MKTLFSLLSSLFCLLSPAFAAPFDDVLAKLSPADRLTVEEKINDVLRECAAALKEKSDAAKLDADARAAAEAKAAAVIAKAETILAAPGDLSPLAEVVAAAKLDAKGKRLAEIAEQQKKLEVEKAELEAKAAPTADPAAKPVATPKPKK